MREYKEMIIEWVETYYQGEEDTKEYQNIMKNINNITFNVFPKITDDITLEEELDIVWNEIDKYKGE